MKQIFLYCFLLPLVLWCCNTQQNNGKQPNKKANIIIGQHEWAAENLAVTQFNNGDPIPAALSKEEWEKAGDLHQPAWTYYNQDSVLGKQYGIIYNWYAVHDARGIAPKGWYIPTLVEWQELVYAIGGQEQAGTILKSKTGWNNNGVGLDSIQFNALAGGYRYNNGEFKGLGDFAAWWTNNNYESTGAWYYFIKSTGASIIRNYSDQRDGYYVRCVREVSSTNEINTDTALISEVTIGKQIWATNNLSVSRFNNGDPIPHIVSAEQWEMAGEKKQPAWCYYNNDSANEKKYGKLYNWYAVHDARGIAPTGWHVASDKEWTELSNTLGGLEKTGGQLKNTSGWKENGNGTNATHFAAMPAGYRYKNGIFNGIDYFTAFWTSTENYTYSAWYRSIRYDDAGLYRGNFGKQDGYAVRCIKN